MHIIPMPDTLPTKNHSTPPYPVATDSGMLPYAVEPVLQASEDGSHFQGLSPIVTSDQQQQAATVSHKDIQATS